MEKHSYYPVSWIGLRCTSRGFVSACLVACGLLGSEAALAASNSGPISDFMMMNVCVSKDGTVQGGAIPGASDCQGERDIRPGEQPPYIMQNFTRTGANCADGGVTKVNLPFSMGNNTRIVSTTFKAGCGGPKAATDIDDAESNGLSIQWYDEGYGFLMGSYSPVALSTFESSLCNESAGTSRRFFRGWVIAPTLVPAKGKAGYGVFPSKLHNGDPKDSFGACATRYNRGLTTWAVDDFTYKSERRLLTILSSHYSRSSEKGTAPGKAMQVEQTFWTREFGLSRWEKWAREDWVHPRSGKSAVELAKRLVASGRCSRPQVDSIDYSANLQVSALLPAQDTYSRVLTDPVSGEKQTWVMTLCEDYTNTSAASPAMNYMKAIRPLADEIYWR